MEEQEPAQFQLRDDLLGGLDCLGGGLAFDLVSGGGEEEACKGRHLAPRQTTEVLQERQVDYVEPWGSRLWRRISRSSRSPTCAPPPGSNSSCCGIRAT